MAQYSRTVLTDAGVILARRMMDETITMEFTRIVTGDGQYSSGEDLAARTALKSQKQSFPLSSRSLTDEDRVLHLKYVISNVNPDSSPLTVGYYVREVGIYAHVTGESEILYAVAIADADTADYMPEYDELQPATITMDWFVTVGNTENITIQASPSAYALAEDLADLADVVDQKLDADGDSKNNTVTFTSSDAADSEVTKSTGWETVAPLASGETHESFMTKFSKIVKNLRWLYKLIGTTDISSIGNGTVTNALSVLNANKVENGTMPSYEGSAPTAKNLIDAADSNVLYLWSQSSSASYNPTGLSSGYWSYILIKPYGSGSQGRYAVFCAFNAGVGYSFDYTNNTWRDINADQNTYTRLTSFSNNWTANGTCFSQKEGELTHIHLAIRNGTKTDGTDILTGLSCTNDFIGPLINREAGTCGYWYVNNSTKTLKIYGVTSNNILLDAYYK